MSTGEFSRRFYIDQITDWVLDECPWFKDMLFLWRPAGDALQRDISEAHKLVLNGQRLEEDPTRLRLAIRDRYLNLYRGGQSVARIRIIAGRLQARIHNKYVYGDTGSGQTYVTVKSAGFPDRGAGEFWEYGGIAELQGWIANANKYVGKEKRFVDSIVARNPDTIDVEMGLPAYSGKGIADRIDLVALEPVDNCYQIVFWEAKLVDDPRARCRGDDVSPSVVDQLGRYTSWLRHDGHRELVVCAYRNTCRLLVKFHELAKRVNPAIGELGPGIVAVAAEDSPPLLIDDKPRLLIDDRTNNLAFTKNGHLDKLRNKGLHVQMVRSEEQMTLGSGV